MDGCDWQQNKQWQYESRRITRMPRNWAIENKFLYTYNGFCFWGAPIDFRDRGVKVRPENTEHTEQSLMYELLISEHSKALWFRFCGGNWIFSEWKDVEGWIATRKGRGRGKLFRGLIFFTSGTCSLATIWFVRGRNSAPALHANRHSFQGSIFTLTLLQRLILIKPCLH